MRPRPKSAPASLALSKSAFRGFMLPKASSHKGQNGIILVIGGSAKYHGAPMLAMLAASRFCDLIFFYSPALENQKIANAIKPRLFEFIGIPKSELKKHLEWADCTLIGNGMEDTPASRKLVISVLKTGSKCVLDAGALYPYIVPCLHKNCLITPHSGEFRRVFGVPASVSSVQERAKKHGCTILCKTPQCDIISDGKTTRVSLSGVPGMTHGGKGDALAGTACAFCATQGAIFEAACMAAFLNGFAGEELAKKSGVFISASDIANALPQALYKLVKKPGKS
ncbi:MAG TPA: NAD(P)H-hydrate dehydratase [Candidatus Micrarchaeota archaeon]|nr:NAD(P)H-hydrate dehydratase [Candidatus Micrarchaeota archaeon]